MHWNLVIASLRLKRRYFKKEKEKILTVKEVAVNQESIRLYEIKINHLLKIDNFDKIGE